MSKLCDIVRKHKEDELYVFCTNVKNEYTEYYSNNEFQISTVMIAIILFMMIILTIVKIISNNKYPILTDALERLSLVIMIITFINILIN